MFPSFLILSSAKCFRILIFELTIFGPHPVIQNDLYCRNILFETYYSMECYCELGHVQRILYFLLIRNPIKAADNNVVFIDFFHGSLTDFLYDD